MNESTGAILIIFLILNLAFISWISLRHFYHIWLYAIWTSFIYNFTTTLARKRNEWKKRKREDFSGDKDNA